VCRTRTMKIVMKVGQGECPLRPLGCMFLDGWECVGLGRDHRARVTEIQYSGQSWSTLDY
jgi:hypothetical protein